VTSSTFTRLGKGRQDDNGTAPGMLHASDQVYDRAAGEQKTVSFLGFFSMFVPSLSW
jgi:hypothetical protein